MAIFVLTTTTTTRPITLSLAHARGVIRPNKACGCVPGTVWSVCVCVQQISVPFEHKHSVAYARSLNSRDVHKLCACAHHSARNFQITEK